MIDISDKTKCSGWTACVNICPKRAIDMVEDEEGFLYPKIDKNKCINCGLCDNTCPIINKRQCNVETKAFVMRVKDEEILGKSTSGGFFTPIAKFVLNKNGVVFGVGFDYRL